MTPLELLLVSVSTVAKVLLIALVGVVVSQRFSGGAASVKGLGYLTVYIMLPLLLFTKIADDLTPEILERCSFAIFASVLAVAIGTLCGYVARPLVAPVDRVILVLGCMCQNAVSYPLSVLYSLRGVAWFGPGELEEAHAYVFLYNLAITVTLWSIARRLIETAATEAGTYKPKERPANKGSVFLIGRPWATQVYSWGASAMSLLLTGPIVASALGIVVALTPPLKAAYQAPPLATLVSGARVLGSGCVPMQLLVLGANLATSHNAKAAKVSTAGPQPDTVAADRAESRRFYATASVVRLVVIPTILFALLHLCVKIGLIPNVPAFKLTMLIEVSAPPAINTSILCSLHNYRTKEFTAMLLVAYLAAVASTTWWLTVALWYAAP